MNERDELEIKDNLDSTKVNSSVEVLSDQHKSNESLSEKTFVLEEDNKNQQKVSDKENNQNNNSPVDNSFTEKSEVHSTLTDTSDNSTKKYIGFKTRLITRTVPLAVSLIILILSILGYSRFRNDKSSYVESSSVNYSVCLLENKYYDDQCLGENSEYVSSLTSLIRTEFNYNLVYQLSQNDEYDYYIRSKVTVGANDSESTILTKEKKLTDINHSTLNGNVLNITENVDIDFSEYNNYVKRYSNDYSINSNAKVLISLVLINNGQEKEVSSISVPLAKTTYSISQNEIDNNEVVYSIGSNTILKNVFLILIITFIIGLIVSLLFLVSFLYKVTNKKSKYDKELSNILNTYDRVIININDSLKYESSFQSKKVYKVTSFFELLDLRDTIDKPIIYQKINNIKSEFYVQDSDAIYKYTMKESDFY